VEGNYKYEFYGLFESSIDDKGRFFLPAPLRKWVTAEENILIMTRGVDRSIFAYPKSNWKHYLLQMHKTAGKAAERDLFNHQMLAWAADCSVDDAGRVRIPQGLIKIALLTRSLKIVGSIDRIEVWDEQRYRDKFEIEDKEYDNRAMELFNERSPMSLEVQNPAALIK